MKKLVLFASFVALLVIIFGTIYVVAQQTQRADANYPQIQIAEDVAASLNKGQKPSSLIGSKVDMNNSLAPFVIIYDKTGKVEAGSGLLNGKVPTVPKGVLTASDDQTYHTVSWQPQDGIRFAVVSVSANKYYVLSGRSIKQAEKNVTKTLLLAFSGGVLSVIVLGAIFMLERSKLLK